MATLADATPVWSIELSAPVRRATEAGDVGLIHFWARATTVTDPLAIARVQVVVQKGSANYDKSLTRTLLVSGQWAEFFLPFSWATGFASNGSEVVLDFGFKRQTVQIGGFEVFYYGKTQRVEDLPITRASYPGREEGAVWRTEALARIAQQRQGDLTVEVVDQAGLPVAGAEVRVTQERHAFPFGTAVPLARLLGTGADNRRFQQKVQALFNSASAENDLKWPPWEGNWGSAFSRSGTLDGLRWLKQRGFRTRGHVLVWPGWENLPTSITRLRGTSAQGEIPDRVLAHIRDIGTATAALTDEWDVLNEPYLNHDLMDLFGQGIMVDWFKAARAVLPSAELYLNDWNNHDFTTDLAHVQNNESVLDVLLQAKAPVDGIGLQAHIGGNPNAPANLLATLDRWAARVGKIRITEFDVNTQDEALQADYTRDFLIAAFSHPAVNGIQLWGFWEGDHWIPDAALYRADWSEKPNGAIYREWVLSQWWTRLSGKTDAAGRWTGRAFYGRHRVEVEVNGQRSLHLVSSVPGQARTLRVSSGAPRLSNLSTRGVAGGASGPLITGLVVTGEAPKTILLRAVGPSLTAFGLQGALPAARLTLFAGQTAVASNARWADGDATALQAAFAQAGAFPMAANSQDAALLVTLAPGSYTAHVQGPDGVSGVALIEAYELNGGTARLLNLSTLGWVGTGENALISGLTVTGTNARTYLIRAVGPGLAEFGVTGPLARPSFIVFREGAPVDANAVWQTVPDPASLAARMAQVGAFALNPKEADAALEVTLEPGSYTVVTAGVADGTGRCLLEIYEITP